MLLLLRRGDDDSCAQQRRRAHALLAVTTTRPNKKCATTLFNLLLLAVVLDALVTPLLVMLYSFRLSADQSSSAAIVERWPANKINNNNSDFPLIFYNSPFYGDDVDASHHYYAALLSLVAVHSTHPKNVSRNYAAADVLQNADQRNRNFSLLTYQFLLMLPTHFYQAIFHSQSRQLSRHHLVFHPNYVLPRSASTKTTSRRSSIGENSCYRRASSLVHNNRELLLPPLVHSRLFAVASAGNAVGFFSSCLSVKCDERDMQQCLQFVQPILTNSSLGYAVNGQQVEQVCQLFRQGMRCVDDFVNKCFDESRRQIFRQSIKGAENVMNKLCYDQHFQAEYIRHAKCYVQLSDKYERCTDAFRRRMALTASESDLGRRILLMCSALQTYLDCAYTISYRRCGLHAAMFLKKYTQEAAGELVSKACEKYLDNNFTRPVVGADDETGGGGEEPPQQQALSNSNRDSNSVIPATTSILSALFTTTTTSTTTTTTSTTPMPHRRHHHSQAQRSTTTTSTTARSSSRSNRPQYNQNRADAASSTDDDDDVSDKNENEDDQNNDIISIIPPRQTSSSAFYSSNNNNGQQQQQRVGNSEKGYYRPQQQQSHANNRQHQQQQHQNLNRIAETNPPAARVRETRPPSPPPPQPQPYYVPTPAVQQNRAQQPQYTHHNRQHSTQSQPQSMTTTIEVAGGAQRSVVPQPQPQAPAQPQSASPATRLAASAGVAGSNNAKPGGDEQVDGATATTNASKNLWWLRLMTTIFVTGVLVIAPKRAA